MSNLLLQLEGFTIDDKIVRRELSAPAKRAKAILEKLPDNKIITTNRLASLIGCVNSTPKNYVVEHLPEYTLKVGNHRIWANPKTIRKAKKKLKVN